MTTPYDGDHTLTGYSTLKTKFVRMTLALALVAATWTQASHAAGTGLNDPGQFNRVARDTLSAMKQRAVALKIQGVAVVAYSPGNTVEGWTSEMAVIGGMTDPAATARGANLLSVAYAKAAEAADSGRDSGTSGNALMLGEFGWKGGMTRVVPGGRIFVAFSGSGGSEASDVEVTQAGLDALKVRP